MEGRDDRGAGAEGVALPRTGPDRIARQLGADRGSIEEVDRRHLGLEVDEVGREDEGLYLVVGHVDRGDAELLQEDAELAAVLLAQLLVEAGEGLVQEEEPGVPRDAAGDRDAPLLPPGEASGHSVHELLDVHAEQLGGAAVLVRRTGVQFGRPLLEQEVGEDVRAGVHVRVEGVVLEHHADPALGRRDLLDVDAVEEDPARVGGVMEGPAGATSK